MSLLRREPPSIHFSKQLYQLSFDESPESVWASGMIWLVAILLASCFGSMSKASAVWEDLKDKVKLWAARKPESFNPIFQSDGSPGDSQ